jgi:hypothetical protein
MLTVMTTRIQGLRLMRAFPQGTGEVESAIPGRAERHAWIAQTLEQAGYRRLQRKERGVAIPYRCRITGYARQQMTRLDCTWAAGAAGAIRLPAQAISICVIRGCAVFLHPRYAQPPALGNNCGTADYADFLRHLHDPRFRR